MVKRILPEQPNTPHYVYVLQTESGAVKIGISNNPNRRLANIQGGNHEKVAIAFTFETPNEEIAKALEAVLHERYGDQRIHLEWYRVPPEQVAADLRFAVAFARVVKQVTYEEIYYEVDDPAITPAPIVESITPPRKIPHPTGKRNKDDPLYDEAVSLARRLDKASISLLQRRLHIGYNRAALLMDVLIKNGIVEREAKQQTRAHRVIG